MATKKINPPTVKAPVPVHTRTQNANPKQDLTTHLGRTIVYQELGPLERFQVMGAIGSKFCENQATLSHAMLVAGIREIDGIPLMLPTSLTLMENMILQAGDDCFMAIIKSLNDDGEAKSATNLTEEEIDLAGK